MANETINDGGPAFPVETITNLGGGASRTHRLGGMSLRDWYAGQAMAALIEKARTGPDTDQRAWVARTAWQMADSMLIARGQSQEAGDA